jgi:hypothetical protein
MKNLNLNLKALVVLTLTFASLQSFASRDCEDILQFSQESTQISAQINFYEQTKTESGADERLAQIANFMVQETIQSMSINNTENAQFDLIQDIVQNGLNVRREQSLQALRQSKLQILYHIRLDEMAKIRNFYAKCFSRNT